MLYEVNCQGRSFEMANLNEAIALAIELYAGKGLLCDIISNVTGEVLVHLSPEELPYVTSAIAYAV